MTCKTLGKFGPSYHGKQGEKIRILAQKLMRTTRSCFPLPLKID